MYMKNFETKSNVINIIVVDIIKQGCSSSLGNICYAQIFFAIVLYIL